MKGGLLHVASRTSLKPVILKPFGHWCSSVWSERIQEQQIHRCHTSENLNVPESIKTKSTTSYLHNKRGFYKQVFIRM